jgi:hypothetical protein
MDLFLRKVIHSAAPDNYRVIIRDGAEIEIGSIGRQFDGWFWGIDTVLPMRQMESEGNGKDCNWSFRSETTFGETSRSRLLFLALVISAVALYRSWPQTTISQTTTAVQSSAPAKK